jgi:hypothetical protein
MENTKTQYESKEALLAAMKHALVELILGTDLPSKLLEQYKAEIEEVKELSENELKARGLLIL